jgi:cell wall-associated NlpC family hydrolase
LPDESRRVEEVSSHFLGVPYVLGPLGEGSGKDPDPLVRFDAVDCVTFVEEMLALTRGTSLDQSKALLQQIRYRGDKIAYEERNHFMEADWVPNNQRKGFVKDITEEVAGPDVLIRERDFTVEDWHHRKDDTSLELPDDKAPVGHFRMAVLPMAKVMAHVAQIPSGTIVLVAHDSRSDQPNRISHVGVVIKSNGQAIVRHASSLQKQVIDEPLDHFVERFSKPHPDWPTIGLVLVQPR